MNADRRLMLEGIRRDVAQIRDRQEVVPSLDAGQLRRDVQALCSCIALLCEDALTEGRMLDSERMERDGR